MFAKLLFYFVYQTKGILDQKIFQPNNPNTKEWEPEQKNVFQNGDFTITAHRGQRPPKTLQKQKKGKMFPDFQLYL